MLNILWATLIISSILYTTLSGNFNSLNTLLLEGFKNGFQLVLNIAPTLLIWMGLMRLVESSGLLDKLTKKITPILSHLFPSLDKNGTSLKYIASNVACNLFGLGSAATPFGLKAMESLQEENENKEVASEAMITFIVLNTSGLTLIPTTVLALRSSYGANASPSIIIPTLLATTLSTIGGLLLDYKRRCKK